MYPPLTAARAAPPPLTPPRNGEGNASGPNCGVANVEGFTMTTESKAVRWGLRLVGIGMILTALALAAWSFGLFEVALTETK